MILKRNIVTIIVIMISMVFSSASFAQGKIERPPQKEPQKATVANTETQKKNLARQKRVKSEKNNAKPQSKHNTSAQAISTRREGEINGYKYVDLGLPSGTKWANRNIGADYPQDNGSYFAWGEVFAKTDYTKDNSNTQNQGTSSLRSQGYIDNDGVLHSSKDAANTTWGATWRIPTKADFEELESYCDWSWTNYRGKYGFKITGKNGNSIFLPASGCINNSAHNFNGQSGIYTISTVNESNDRAYAFIFGSNEHYVSWRFRFIGSPVRPVSN